VAALFPVNRHLLAHKKTHPHDAAEMGFVKFAWPCFLSIFTYRPVSEPPSPREAATTRSDRISGSTSWTWSIPVGPVAVKN
jgi:hypothetical protein